jgi:hypothetical protein
LPGKRLTDLAAGELEFARRYLSGFALNIWLADRSPDYEVTSPAANVVRVSARKIANDQGGIKFPRRVWILHDGARLADITTEEIKLNSGLQAADLALKPADLNRVLSGR